MTRKIIIFIKCVTARNYLVDFRESSEIYSYLPDVYVFLQSMSKYHQIKKKMMQSANRIINTKNLSKL